MKSFDIGKLSDDDLLLLNHEIISLVKSRHRLRGRRKLLSFDIGDSVTFEGPEGGKVHGKILRVNQKTVTIATDKGTWRVDGSCVSKDRCFPPLISNLVTAPICDGAPPTILKPTASSS